MNFRSCQPVGFTAYTPTHPPLHASPELQSLENPSPTVSYCAFWRLLGDGKYLAGMSVPGGECVFDCTTSLP